jgi:hypothetical protein
MQHEINQLAKEIQLEINKIDEKLTSYINKPIEFFYNFSIEKNKTILIEIRKAKDDERYLRFRSCLREKVFSLEEKIKEVITNKAIFYESSETLKEYKSINSILNEN